MHTISLADALELFKLPRKLGQDKDEEVSVGIGRFGPFAKRGAVYASLKKEDDPYTIDLARAVFLIEEKEEIARNRIIKAFDGSDIQVLNGRYGPYISDGKLNGRIPKDREPASLTLEEVHQADGRNRQADAWALRQEGREEGAGEGRGGEGAAEQRRRPRRSRKKTAKKAAKKTARRRRRKS
jgi:DNA topoisomerase-1